MPENRHAIEPEEIMAYLDGELASGRASEAMTHLDRCSECQGLAGDLRRVSLELSAWQVETPDLTAPAMDAPKQAPRPVWRIVPTWAFGTAGVILILVFFVTPRSRPRTMVGSQADFGSRMKATFAALPAGSVTPTLRAEGYTENAPGPMIERTAQLTLIAPDFDQLRARIDAILARRHGYLAELTVNAPDNAGRSLNASLRIPAAQLDSALAELKQLGRVHSETQGGQDVSKQYIDLMARLSNARNTSQRLTQLLAQRTGKLSDVLAVETELGRVQGEIEQMEAERKNTEAQVAYASLQLNVSENYKAQLRGGPDSTLNRFRNAAIEGYRSMADSVISAALFVVAYAPSVLLWAALLFFPARALWRRSRRAAERR